MKHNFIDLINQIEQQQFVLGNSISELKKSLIEFENQSNISGLLIVSGSIRNIDELINCIKPNIMVLKYGSESSLEIFKSKLSETLSKFKPNQLKSIGWVFDNNNKNLKLSSDYEIVLQNHYNVHQYQNLIDIINLVSEYVDKSYTNRFDLISCDLSSEPYSHMIKMLELGTDFNFAYSNDLTGNVANSDWVLENGNINLLDTYFDKSKIDDLKVEIILGTSSIVTTTFLTSKGFNSSQNTTLINAKVNQDQITSLLSLKFTQAQITNLVNKAFNIDQIITLANGGFSFQQIMLIMSAGISYAQITNLITNGFKPIHLITSNLSATQLAYITQPGSYNTSFVQTLTSAQIVGLFKAGLTSSMFLMDTSDTIVVKRFRTVGLQYLQLVMLLNLGYSYSVVINLIAQSEISMKDFYNDSTGLHNILIARGFTVGQIDDFLRYLSITKLKTLTGINWAPNEYSTSTQYKRVIFKPNPNTDITGIDILQYYNNIATNIANRLTPIPFYTQFPQKCDFDLYVKNNPNKSITELEDYLVENSIDAGIDIYLVSAYTDIEKSTFSKKLLLFCSKLTIEGIRQGFQSFADGLSSTLKNTYSGMSDIENLRFDTPEFAAALANALRNSPYLKSQSNDQIANFFKTVGSKIDSYANKEISVLESNVKQYASVVETSTKQFVDNTIYTVANSDELKKLKSGITLVSKDMTKFATKFGDEFKTAMVNAPWTEITAYLEEVSAYMAAFDPTGLGGLAFAVKDLTESSIAFKADKSNDNLFNLVFAVINCVLALVGVLMFVAGGAASIAKKMVFQVLDRLVVPLLSAYGAIVPALITYINDPTGGEAPQTNKQALIDACVQSGIGIAMAQA